MLLVPSQKPVSQAAMHVLITQTGSARGQTSTKDPSQDLRRQRRPMRPSRKL